jgi:hypothetical protein
MLKKRIIAVAIWAALTTALVSSSALIAESLVTSMSATGQAIACVASGSSGGGC